MKRFLSAIFALCLVAVVLVVGQPASRAEATPDWTKTYTDQLITGVNADDAGGVTLMSCRISPAYNSSPQATYIGTSGVTLSKVPSFSQDPQICETSYEASVGGVVYTWTLAPYGVSSDLTAWKNGRKLWTKDTTSPTNCYSSGAKAMTPSSMSIGPDGNVYMVLTVGDGMTGSSCPERLFGVDPETSITVMDVALSTPPSIGTAFKSGAWTYENYILVVDRLGVLKKFEYDSDEVWVSGHYPYTFAPGSGRQFMQFVANSAGTVYAVTQKNSGNPELTVNYHKDSSGTGSTGSITNSSAHPGYAPLVYSFDSDGNYVMIEGGARVVDVFDLSTGTVVPWSVPTGTTYNSYTSVSGYSEDENGNALVLKTQYTTGWAFVGTSVDYVDGSTGVATELFSQSGMAGGHQRFDRGIADGYLYLALCDPTCGGASSPGDSDVYKIDVGTAGFGTPITTKYGQHGSYVSEELTYVAMGDSFASGEGVVPFIVGTANDDVNECHRSQDGYAALLDESTSVSWNLQAFTACSGALTNHVRAGGSGAGAWDEPAQVTSLSEATDVVTISIGGNDALFADTLTTCNYMQEPPPSWLLSQYAYDEQMCLAAMQDSQDLINGVTTLGTETLAEKLTAVYEAVLDEVGEGAEVYVIGYPHLYPAYEDTETICKWGYNLNAQGTSYRDVSEDEINLIRETSDDLATQITNTITAVDDERLHFVDTRAAFEGHELCTTSPYITKIDTTTPSGSFHPNADGQEAFKSAIIAAAS